MYKDYRARPTDVVIGTAMKGGTTWMQNILWQLKSGGDTSFENIFDVVPWLEIPSEHCGATLEQRLATLEALCEPRIFKTHAYYEQVHWTAEGWPRVVLTLRNPIDSVVSFYHYYANFTEEARRRFGLPPVKPINELAAYWAENSPYWKHAIGWWEHRNDANVLLLTFDDLKRDLPAAIDRIIKFTGWNVSAETRAKAIEHSSFKWMKENQHKFDHFSPGQPTSFRDGQSLIRKGESGEGSKELEPQVIEKINARARRDFPPELCDFLRVPIAKEID